MMLFEIAHSSCRKIFLKLERASVAFSLGCSEGSTDRVPICSDVGLFCWEVPGTAKESPPKSD